MAQPMAKRVRDPILEHKAPWTLEEVLALPEDNGQRIELLDGTLLVSPAPAYAHQRLLHRLQVMLDPAVPADCELMPGINVVLNSKRLLIPDLAVTTTPGAEVVYGMAADILLAVEIVSPSSEVTDKVLKRKMYADAGVQFYLVVEQKRGEVDSVLFELAAGEYREAARSDGGVLRLERPFAVTLDLSA